MPSSLYHFPVETIEKFGFGHQMTAQDLKEAMAIASQVMEEDNLRRRRESIGELSKFSVSR